jgi:methionyl-tRNA formyltransferase
LKRTEQYESLYEFIVDAPGVPIVPFSKDPDILEKSLSTVLGKINPNHYIILSCIFPLKIPVNILRIKKAINIHPGKLPNNRGPNPYFWAIVNKEKDSAITFHVMSDKFDTGNILFAKSIPICSKDSEYNVEMKTRQALKECLPDFFREFDHIWKCQNEQQGEAYYKEPGFRERKRFRRFSIISLRDFKLFLWSFVGREGIR